MTEVAIINPAEPRRYKARWSVCAWAVHHMRVLCVLCVTWLDVKVDILLDASTKWQPSSLSGLDIIQQLPVLQRAHLPGQRRSTARQAAASVLRPQTCMHQD